MMFEKYDTVIGTVDELNHSGAYITVENTNVRAYYKGHAALGDRVMLTVIIPEPRNFTAMFCMLDSVVEYAPVRSVVDIEVKLGERGREGDIFGRAA